MASKLAMVFLALVGFVSLAAPWLYPGDPLDLVAPALQPPFLDLAQPLGSDRLGRDLAALLCHGGRETLQLGLLAAISALGIGVTIGVAAGMAGGWGDRLLMAFTEALQTIPPILLALTALAVLGPSRSSLGIAISLMSWPGMAQLVRSETRLLCSRDFFAAARLAGQGPVALVRDQLLPNLFCLILILLSNGVGTALLIETSLSYLGLGDPDILSWGQLIAQGRDFLYSAPHIALLPALTIIATLLSIVTLSDRVSAWLEGSISKQHLTFLYKKP